MILQALTAYYEQLLRQGKIAAPGWDGRFKVSYELRLNDAGQLVDVVDLRVSETKGKKTVIVPRELRVPAHVKRTVGIAANFLCDNSSYLLGADEKGKPDRAKQCFEACAQLHHKLLDGVDDPAAKAILAYFDSWDPAQAAEHPLLNAEWKDLTGNANLIFGYEAPDHHHILANDAPAIQAAWQAHYGAADADAATMQCLITGKQAPAALVHPAIKGVMGAQSAGAALVSFNAPAFCSYGHEQGENAPVSEYAAFAYTTALNLLIADRNHCKRVGDTTIVCWAESAEPAYQDAFSLFLFGAEEASGIKETDVQAALKRLAAGQTVPFLEKELAPDQHFYVLGLAPNAARLSVRFFLRDTFGTFARNLQKHADALEITRPAYDNRKTLSVWALAMETVNRKERSPSPAPQLAGDLLRAVLTGGRYPRHTAQRRDDAHPRRAGRDPRARRHSESLLPAQFPHRSEQGGLYCEPERNHQCALHSGAAVLCAGSSAERCQPRHQHHHQRPVFQFRLCHTGSCVPHPAQAGTETFAEAAGRQGGLLQQADHRAGRPCAGKRLPRPAEPAGSGQV